MLNVVGVDGTILHLVAIWSNLTLLVWFVSRRFAKGISTSNTKFKVELSIELIDPLNNAVTLQVQILWNLFFHVNSCI